MLMRESFIRVLPNSFRLSMSYFLFIIPLFLGITGCAGEGAGDPSTTSGLASTEGGDQDPVITMTPAGTGVTAQLTWDPPPHFDATGYTVYYGKRSAEEDRSEESGVEEPSTKQTSSCALDETQTVNGPQATITGLKGNTEYVFSIRALNETESLCSNEITAVTPPIQS